VRKLTQKINQLPLPESRGRLALWSFFWERGEFEGRKPVLSKKMGFLPSKGIIHESFIS